MKKFATVLIIALLAFSCNKVKDKTKETLNKGGEAVGEMATEFVEGVSEGVDQTLGCTIVISDALKQQGLETGKYYIESQEKGNYNKLVVYLITNKDINNTITVLLKDKKGLEYGRKQFGLSAKAGEAKYYDIDFDPRTDIEVKSSIEFK